MSGVKDSWPGLEPHLAARHLLHAFAEGFVVEVIVREYFCGTEALQLLFERVQVIPITRLNKRGRT